jgi:hypothetical protein
VVKDLVTAVITKTLIQTVGGGVQKNCPQLRDVIHGRPLIGFKGESSHPLKGGGCDKL